MKAFMLFLITFNLNASDWVDIKIPGAKCGDGKPYSVFFQKGSENKLLVEFMGGGACWDYESCFGKFSILPWLHRYPVMKSYSIFTANYSSRNPVKGHSKLYFPYCTADVHAGDHISTYKDKTVHHWGKRNVESAFIYLKENDVIKFESVNDLVVYGASAGAIATLIYSKQIGEMIQDNAKKTMVVDSPGLHFGKKFWNKFDQDMKYDFNLTFQKVNLDVDFNDGAVSKKMSSVFDSYPDWKMGIIMALEDRVMSKVFGEISPESHKKLMLSTDGIPYIAKNYPNVKIWLKDTSMHTFMLSKYSADMTSISGETASEFVDRLLN